MENCKHENKDSNSFINISMDLDGDLYLYIKRISETCGYSEEVVLSVLVAIGMDREIEFKKVRDEILKGRGRKGRGASSRRSASPRRSK